MTVHLINNTTVTLDVADPALEGVENLIVECLMLDLEGKLEMSSVYLTSGDFPFMLVSGFGDVGFEAAEKYTDGNVYGSVSLTGMENDFTQIAVEDFPYDGAVALDM